MTPAGTAEDEPGYQIIGQVSLLRYPLRIGAERMAYFTELFRELELVRVGESRPGPHHHPAPRRLIEIVELVTGRFAEALRGPRASIERASAAGLAELDVSYPVVAETESVIEEWARVTREVDEFCRRGELLTFPASDEVRRLEEWNAAQFLGQLHGEPPQPWPGPW